ncbi:ABC-2 type transport system permease protein [Thermosyntropha lipolytica DSM 11003]|uniref:ABC-2 type transport system permease protein n=1 Tax=Thermosyntropha lipolytica DSM 11003 TaxID=1123382 RepID=A0A1M5M851_9FIRM|nr:DUF6449 domain-containing protein [Thermosyntropha lipolytica]SHG72983.1 ABC-2 type transport system permease protein [Thermosyntropha lipolytica DSM 11003]
MRSNNFLINKGILKNDMKRWAFLGIIYFLGIFFLIPLRIIMLQHMPPDFMAYDMPYKYLEILMPYRSPMLAFLLLAMPVLTGILLFRYLQNGEEVAFHHALPVSRKTFYHTHMLAGCILLLVPLFLNIFIVWLLAGIYGIPYLSGIYLGKWLFLSSLLNLFMLSLCVFLGTITGMSFLQALLTFIALYLPAGFIFLLNTNLGFLLWGWPAEYYSYVLERYDLVNRIMNLYGANRFTYLITAMPTDIVLDYRQLLLPFFLMAVFYLAGLYLYNRRKLERAGEAITFDILKEIFRYGVVFCVMLLLGSYWGETQGSIIWTYTGYLLGSLLAYAGVEILLARSFDIFHLRIWRGYLVYGLAIIFMLLVVKIDIAGYEKKLPDLDDIKYVYMDQSFGYFKLERDIEQMIKRGADPKELKKQGLTRPALNVFYGEENIKKIIELQEKIVADRESLKRERNTNMKKFMNHPGYQKICLIYEKKDGSLFIRQYAVERKRYASALKPVYESEEYKKNNFSIYHLPLAKVREMSINGYEVEHKNVVIKDPALIAEAVAALKKDIESLTYEEMFKPGRTFWGSIDFIIEDDSPPEGYRIESIAWEKTFTYFDEWLKKIGKYEEARIIPGKDISCVLIKKIEEKDPEKFIKKVGEQKLELDLLFRQGFVRIDDKEAIEYCLRCYVYPYAVQEDLDYLNGYLVVFARDFENTTVPVFTGIITEKPSGI